MPLMPYKGNTPTIGQDCYIAPTAMLIGDVTSTTARASGSVASCAATSPPSSSAPAPTSRITPSFTAKTAAPPS